jgi:hypothetical protein
MTDPAPSSLTRYLHDADGLSAKERKALSNRAAGRERTLRRQVLDYMRLFPKAQVLFVIQSGFSTNFPVLEVGGPMRADAVFADDLAEAVVRAIDSHGLRPAEKHKVTIGGGGGGGGGEGYAGLRETLERAAIQGDIGASTAKRLLAICRQLNKGEPWGLE